MFPSTTLDALSEHARRLYKRAANDYHRQVKSTTEIEVAALTELASAGFGTTYINREGEATFRAIVRAKGFTVAKRNIDEDDERRTQHYSYIEVEVLDNANDRDRGYLLASLYGATFENRGSGNSPWPVFTAQVRHESARDADHSASILATLDFDHPVLDSIRGGATTMIATLSAIRMWPTGTDITLLDTFDSTPIEEPDYCDREGACARNPHPYGPFQPEKCEDLDRFVGHPVRITITPVSLVKPNGFPKGRRTITHATEN